MFTDFVSVDATCLVLSNYVSITKYFRFFKNMFARGLALINTYLVKRFFFHLLPTPVGLILTLILIYFQTHLGLKPP